MLQCLNNSNGDKIRETDFSITVYARYDAIRVISTTFRHGQWSWMRNTLFLRKGLYEGRGSNRYIEEDWRCRQTDRLFDALKNIICVVYIDTVLSYQCMGARQAFTKTKP